MPLEGATSRHVLAHRLLCSSPRKAPWGLGPRPVKVCLQRWEGLRGTLITRYRRVLEAAGRAPRRSRA
eukprot:474243-Alexandrium_andersonii.AAC.1